MGFIKNESHERLGGIMKLLNSVAVGAAFFILTFSSSWAAEHGAITPTGGRGAYTPTGSQANKTDHTYGGVNYNQGRIEPHQYNLNQPYSAQRQNYVDHHYGNNWNNNNWNRNNWNNNNWRNRNNNWNNNWYDNSGGGYGYGYGTGNFGYNGYSDSSDATYGTENMTPSEEAMYQYNQPSNGYRGNPVFYNNSFQNSDNID